MRKQWIPAGCMVAMSVLLSSAWAQEAPDRESRGRDPIRGPRGDRPAGPAIEGGLKLFEMLDADGDGMISKEEFQSGPVAEGRRMRDRERDRGEDRPERPMRDRARLGGPDIADGAPPPAKMEERRMRGREQEGMEDRPGRPMGPRGGFSQAEGLQGPPAIARLEQRIREIVREELAKLRAPGGPSPKGAAFCPSGTGPAAGMRRNRMDDDRVGPLTGRLGRGRPPMDGRSHRSGEFMGPGMAKEECSRIEEIRQAVRMLERALDAVEGGKFSPQDREYPVERERPQQRRGWRERRLGNGMRGGFPGEDFRGGPWHWDERE